MTMIGLAGYMVTPIAQPAPERATVENVLPPGMKAPERGVTLLYGFRDTLAELSRQRRAAEERGQHLYDIRLKVEVGEIPVGRISLRHLPDLRFLHFGRMTADLENMVMQTWSKLLPPNLSAREIDQYLPYKYNQFIIGRPDLVGRLRQEPPFQHLDVIVYRIAGADGAEEPRHVATLFNAKAVRAIECEEARIHIDLPKRLGA